MEKVIVMVDGEEVVGEIQYRGPEIKINDPEEGPRIVTLLVIEYNGFAHPHFNTDIIETL